MGRKKKALMVFHLGHSEADTDWRGVEAKCRSAGCFTEIVGGVYAKSRRRWDARSHGDDASVSMATADVVGAECTWGVGSACARGSPSRFVERAWPRLGASTKERPSEADK